MLYIKAMLENHYINLPSVIIFIIGEADVMTVMINL